MLGLRLESRIPSELFVQAPFIYSGPDFVSFPLGMISDLINYRGKSIQRFWPLTISKVLSNGNLVDQVFCFAFFYIEDRGDPVLFLTYPYWFDRSDLEESSQFFFGRVEDLARSVGSKRIKAELHELISPPVSFPNSVSEFSYDLDVVKIQETNVRLFQEHGFQDERILLCYDRRIEDARLKMEERHGTRSSFMIGAPDQSKIAAIDAQICEFPLREYCLSKTDPILTRRITHFFSDSQSIAYKRDAVFPKRRIEGFCQWSPNLFEFLKENRSPIPFLFYDHLTGHRFKCAKFFRWGLRSEDPELLVSLVFHGLQSMERHGIERCQIGPVDRQQMFMTSMLESYGFHVAHKARILRKDLW